MVRLFHAPYIAKVEVNTEVILWCTTSSSLYTTFLLKLVIHGYEQLKLARVFGEKKRKNNSTHNRTIVGNHKSQKRFNGEN